MTRHLRMSENLADTLKPKGTWVVQRFSSPLHDRPQSHRSIDGTRPGRIGSYEWTGTNLSITKRLLAKALAESRLNFCGIINFFRTQSA